MVLFDDRCARSVAVLEVVGESVVHARIDLELAYPSSGQLALDSTDEPPHQALPAVRGVDQDVEEAHSPLSPFGSRDRKSNKRRSVPGRHHNGIAVRGLPAHLAL
jgi:hypothetical protein